MMADDDVGDSRLRVSRLLLRLGLDHEEAHNFLFIWPNSTARDGWRPYTDSCPDRQILPYTYCFGQKETTWFKPKQIYAFTYIYVHTHIQKQLYKIIQDTQTRKFLMKLN